jgi:pimeloyl-ACP methyl ester carboxylesterase
VNFVSGVETGRIRAHPYVRVGGGDRTLLVIPGLNDPLHTVADSAWFPLLMARYCQRYADAHAVYFVSRPHGLASGLTTRDMARGYAAVLESIGSADVLGLSMGGFVVSHLAADFPDLVERAVLGLAADRTSPRGRRVVDRWVEWGRAGRWGRVYRDAYGLISVPPLRWILQAGATGYDLVSDPVAPDDFFVSADACLSHEAGVRSGEIDAETLVIGGTEDPFFSPEAFRRTARSLPSGRLALLSGIGHEAAIHYPSAFDGTIRRFLTTGDPRPESRD